MGLTNMEITRMTKDEALKLALEAFDSMIGRKPERVEQAITAIKEALTPSEQCQCPNCKVTLHASDCAVHSGPAYPAGGCDCGAQPEQEPLAWISTGTARMIHWTADKPAYGDDWVPLYTAPPQRTWVGLTDEEIGQGCKESWVTEQAWQSAVWWAEARLKEKNNG